MTTKRGRLGRALYGHYAVLPYPHLWGHDAAFVDGHAWIVPRHPRGAGGSRRDRTLSGLSRPPQFRLDAHRASAGLPRRARPAGFQGIAAPARHRGDGGDGGAIARLRPASVGDSGDARRGNSNPRSRVPNPSTGRWPMRSGGSTNCSRRPYSDAWICCCSAPRSAVSISASTSSISSRIALAAASASPAVIATRTS